MKGSRHGRETTDKSKIKPSTVQKDNDFIDAKYEKDKTSKKLFQMAKLNKKLKSVLQKDTQFL